MGAVAYGETFVSPPHRFSRRRKVNHVLASLHRERDGRCFYCDCVTKLPAGPVPLYTRVKAVKNLATREHLHRIADGGGNYRENLTLACAHCNHGRGTATPHEHHAAMQFLARIAGRHPCHPSQHNEHVILLHRQYRDEAGKVCVGTVAEGLEEYRIAWERDQQQFRAGAPLSRVEGGGRVAQAPDLLAGAGAA